MKQSWNKRVLYKGPDPFNYSSLGFSIRSSGQYNSGPTSALHRQNISFPFPDIVAVFPVIILAFLTTKLF